MIKDSSCSGILYFAIKQKFFNVIQIFLENGADPNIYENNKSLFLFACKIGQNKIIKLFLKFGANVNQTEDYGTTNALHILSKYN